MIRVIFLGVTLILGAITIYCYFTDKPKPASIISIILTILSLIITICPTILDREEINPNIVLDDNKLEMFIGDEYILNATASPDNTVIEWNSDSEIATIDDNGHLKAINEGTAQISATITYKKVTYTDSCEVVIKVPEINLDSSCLINIEETKKLSVVTTPNDINIIWNCNDTNIVTVNDNGEIKGISEGTATITATVIYNDINYSAECIITVKSQSTDYSNNNQDIDNTQSDKQKTNKTEVSPNDNLQESETNIISIKDVAWLDNEKIYEDDSATTMRGEKWYDCIRFGSSNINSDGTSVLRAICDKYNRFTAEFAPQEGFDKSETVTLYVYGANDEGQTFKEEYQIDYSAKNIMVDVDISNSDELYIWKTGDYNQGRIAGQFINGYTGMGVLMRDATLYE